MSATIDSILLETTTPEKLAIMKLNAADVDRSVFSDAGDDLDSRDADFSSSRMNGMSSFRSSKSVRRSSSRRSTGNFIAAHREKMSLDMSSQAEGKFFALMDLISGASREASSLKEYWASLMSDRESWAKEREDLLAQIQEYSEVVELRESQHSNHGKEIIERKKEVEKLLLELSAALAGIQEQKRRVAERDSEIERVRGEVHEIRMSGSRSQIDYDKVKSELEVTFAKLRTLESERDHAREDTDKYRNELRLLAREHGELKSKFSEISFKLETFQQEIITQTERARTALREQEDQLFQKDSLEAELRKANHRADDNARELAELTERYERSVREVTRQKETVRVLENEREESSITIEHLRHDLKNKTNAADEAEGRYSEILLKYEKLKRETSTHQDRVREVELEITTMRSNLDKKQEEYRSVVIERDSFRDELDEERRKVHDSHRRIVDLETSLRQTETTLTEVRSEHASVTERIRVIEVERNGDKDKHGHLHGEIGTLKEQLILLQAEITNITGARDRARKELAEYKRRYEEVVETTETSYDDHTGELEFEIESLRTLLREAREQKETAIKARMSADSERDSAIAKYEAKVRELENYEESRSSYLAHHNSSHGHTNGKTTTTRTFSSRSGMSSHNHHHEEGK